MDILKRTSTHFESINFNELSESWLNDLIQNEFTDVEANNMSISYLFTSTKPVKTLKEICSICELWVNKAAEKDNSFSGNITSRPEESLFSYLSTLDISVKQIFGTIYLLCSTALKSGSSNEMKELGLMSSKWYFSSLKVPGNGAYSFYHSHLFKLCIDCFQIPDLVEQKDAVYTWRDLEMLFPVFISSLGTLIPLLDTFHLGNDTSIVDHVIYKLCDLIAVEHVSAEFDFDLNSSFIIQHDSRRKGNYAHNVANYAFKGLTSLIWGKLNGDSDYIYSQVLSRLNRHILCLRVRKHSTIPVKFACIKENVLSFICHNLKKDIELCSSLTLTALKRLCLTVCDKADFRSTVAAAVGRVLFLLYPEDFVDMIQWLLRLADAAESNNRVFGMELLGSLLGNVPQVNGEELPESLHVYLTSFPIIFTILTRCDDTSPNVRTRSLAMLSQCIAEVLNCLGGLRDISDLPQEDFEDILECDVNGEHRSFWYSFRSLRALLNEITNILHRRIEDNNSVARRAALQALESIIRFDAAYLLDENMKLFLSAAKDSHVSMRKQTVVSLSSILEKYPDERLAQENWIKCIMPLVQDPENSVQGSVLGALEEKFLTNVFSNQERLRIRAFNLLRKLSCGKYLSHQRYLMRAFISWKKEKKLRGQVAANLEKELNKENADLVWFYWSIYSTFCKLPAFICERTLTEYQNQSNLQATSDTEYMLKILSNMYDNLSPKSMDDLKELLQDKLNTLDVPVEVIPLMIEILNKFGKSGDNSVDFRNYAENLFKSSVDILIPFTTKNTKVNRQQETQAVNCFTIIKELCQIFHEFITADVTKIIKRFVFSALSDNSSQDSSKKITPLLQAHAFAALGKICLQDEVLANEVIATYAKASLVSKHDMIRNNAVLVLIEMCKRYTSFADKYLTLISFCFKDKLYLIRYQTVTLIIGLLQEEYIKWKGSLLYCLLSTIIDKSETIQDLGKYCMTSLLLKKKQNIFQDSFIDAIFIFNNFAPPNNDTLRTLIKRMDDKFAIKGNKRREQRMQIYKFMLNFIDPVSKGLMVRSICHDIITLVAEGVFPLTSTMETIIRDCFAIITSQEIRAFNAENIVTETEEDDEEHVTKVELDARRLMIVEPCIEPIIKLKNCVRDAKSELLNDIVHFLKDILQDYRSQVSEILIADKMLRTQVEMEFKKETMQQEKDRKMGNARPTAKKATDKTTDDIVELAQNLLRESIAPIGNSDTSMRLVPKLPLQTKDVQRTIVSDEMPSTSRASSISRSLMQLTSTPRVVLKPLSLRGINNFSNIECDSD